MILSLLVDRWTHASRDAAIALESIDSSRSET
jgi:hypothetical protein